MAAAVIFIELTSWVALSDRPVSSRSPRHHKQGYKMHHLAGSSGFWDDSTCGSGKAGRVASQARVAGLARV
ncbi:hypothetical protein Q7V75_26535 [Microcoleus sp. F10B5]